MSLLGPVSRRLGLIALLGCGAFLSQANIGLTSRFEERVLAAHNRERASAGVPALRWDEDLARSAAAWADRLQTLDRLEHAPQSSDEDDVQGENLWAGTLAAYSTEEMVGAWVAEKRNFKPGVFPANSRTGKLQDVGHYTQLMWRSTTSLGCALARGRDKDFLVCRYSEGGNVIGERPF